MATNTPQPLTLTKTAAFARKGIIVTGILVVTIMVGRIFLSAAVSYWKATHPPAPPPPTVGFGVLPRIDFPVSKERPSSYQLEVPPSKVPQLGDRAKVFFMPISEPSLLAVEKANQKAASFGFVFEPEVLDERTYRWTKGTPIDSTLEIDTYTGTFELTTAWSSHPEIFSNPEFLDVQQTVSRVKALLQQSGELPADLATVSGQVEYVRAIGDEFRVANGQTDAQALRVSLSRAPIDGFSVKTPYGNQGLVQAVLLGNQVLYMNSNYYDVDYETYETYPLRSLEYAWKVLSNGEGYVASKGDFDTAVIRDIYLAYFDSFEEQQYMQPVYVFEGDGGFLGFVEAIDPQFLKSGE